MPTVVVVHHVDRVVRERREDVRHLVVDHHVRADRLDEGRVARSTRGSDDLACAVALRELDGDEARAAGTARDDHGQVLRRLPRRARALQRLGGGHPHLRERPDRTRIDVVTQLARDGTDHDGVLRVRPDGRSPDLVPDLPCDVQIRVTATRRRGSVAARNGTFSEQSGPVATTSPEKSTPSVPKSLPTTRSSTMSTSDGLTEETFTFTSASSGSGVGTRTRTVSMHENCGRVHAVKLATRDASMVVGGLASVGMANIASVGMANIASPGSPSRLVRAA
jgi:hypothetical protein